MPDSDNLEFGLGQLKNRPIVTHTNAKESGLSFEGFTFFVPGRLALLGHVCDCTGESLRAAVGQLLQLSLGAPMNGRLVAYHSPVFVPLRVKWCAILAQYGLCAIPFGLTPTAMFIRVGLYSSSMEQQIAEGDRVEVDIVNNCPLGGSVQMSSFTVESVAINEVSGSSDWCDSHTITGFGTDSIEYSDAGKSGEVAEVRVMETGDDGVTIHGSGTVVA